MGYLAAKVQRIRARQSSGADIARRLGELRVRVEGLEPPPSFATALRSANTIALIAEFKRRSPSAGTLVSEEHILDAVTLYEQCGACALSILTDTEDFAGSLSDLEMVTCSRSLPVLRKDFLIDELDLLEARGAGAAAVLLIVRLLEPEELRVLLEVSAGLTLDCLVEVHNEGELQRALDAGAMLVGINNRDLDSLTTDLAVTQRLGKLIPPSVTVISESGIRSADDVARVRDAGAHAVLVGESLLRLDRKQRRALTTQLAGVTR